MPGKLPLFTKYLLKFKMEINGFVERNDIIGAIFGQLEGVLPPELDPQNLLNTGRIGRIEVSIVHKEGKTYADIVIPCSLNRIEAAILAAAIETIDKIGPASAETRLDKIENIMEDRRRRIIERASTILTSWSVYEKSEIPPERLPRLIEEKVKKSRIITYGPEKLPAGVGILKSDEIIIVEGRADVLNLLKNGYDNAIAVGGSGTIPKSIIELSKKKTTTAFVDGDRAGLLLLKSLLQVADIDYITVAPKGKEVEELTFKEIKRALENRIPTDKVSLDIDRLEYIIEQFFGKIKELEKKGNVKEFLEAHLEKIQGSKKFIIYNDKLEEIFSGSANILENILNVIIENFKTQLYAIILDATPHQDLINKLKKAGFKYLAYRTKDSKIHVIEPKKEESKEKEEEKKQNQ